MDLGLRLDSEGRGTRDGRLVRREHPSVHSRDRGLRLHSHARECWPDLAAVTVRFQANFAYIDGEVRDGPTICLCRLRYGGSSHRWGFAIYLASRDGHEDSVLPSGEFSGSPEEALDCACGLDLEKPEV
jgi:hypothetical protein